MTIQSKCPGADSFTILLTPAGRWHAAAQLNVAQKEQHYTCRFKCILQLRRPSSCGAAARDRGSAFSQTKEGVLVPGSASLCHSKPDFLPLLWCKESRCRTPRSGIVSPIELTFFPPVMNVLTGCCSFFARTYRMLSLVTTVDVVRVVFRDATF